MPHMAGYCTCGRRMHWPKSTRLGDTWECYRCGEVWTWSIDGDNKMAETRSRAPKGPIAPPMPTPAERRTKRPQPVGSGAGCAVVLLAGAAALASPILWWLV